ncbi:MAG: glycosyltransferase, partial [Desulfovibrio sp.]|nr:glycosyltransferase [Desulfovibrio sp.]
EFAEAAAMLKKRRSHIRFQALGPREQGLGSISDQELAQWARDGSVEYLGEARDVRPYIEACSVLVLPSWREGTPTAVMEAMSMGRAAVVTDVPGCREVVRDGVNGFLVPARNPAALAGAMERFLDDPDLARAMGAEGRRIAETEFDAETVARNILKDMHVPA